jgi:DNA mismatch repair protein MutS
LQVAQLAGVPQPVIRAARRHLATLEAHSVQSTPQFDLFASAIDEATPTDNETPTDRTASEVMDELAAIDPDALSPREALDALYRLKKLSDVQHDE